MSSVLLNLLVHIDETTNESRKPDNFRCKTDMERKISRSVGDVKNKIAKSSCLLAFIHFFNKSASF